MKRSLESRIAALEAVAPAETEMIIIRRVISPDFPDAESSVATMGGIRYTRGADESEDQFRERLVAIAERLQASGNGPVRMIMSPFEEDCCE